MELDLIVPATIEFPATAGAIAVQQHPAQQHLLPFLLLHAVDQEQHHAQADVSAPERSVLVRRELWCGP